MSTFLDDILAADMGFAAGSMPGDEYLPYWSRGATAAASVWINIERKGPTPVPDIPGSFTAQEMTGFLYAGQGITAIDTGGDTVTVALSFGGTAIRVPVVETIREDAGGWLLRLQ